MRVELDRARCGSLGICESVAPSTSRSPTRARSRCCGRTSRPNWCRCSRRRCSAARPRRCACGHDRPDLPYDRPPLSKAYLLDDVPAATTFRTREQLAALGVDLRLGRRAVGLDARRREVRLDGDGPGAAVGYDALVLATGASPRAMPGTGGTAGVHVLRTAADAAALRAALDAGPRHVVVVGAGFIGSEVASAARARGLHVTVVEAAQHPLARALGPRLGVACALLHARHGTRLRAGVGVSSVRADGGGRVSGVRLADGTELAADLLVVGIGARPAVGWLAGSGLAVDDGVVCDATLAASRPGVYAAGDVARWHNPLLDRAMRLEHWTSAAEQGGYAARNALDPASARPYATVPYFWSDWYGTRIQFVGVPAPGEQRVVLGDLDPRAGADRLVALYREGNRLAGPLLIGEPASTMKYRALIARACSWDDAVEFARRRHGPLARSA